MFQNNPVLNQGNTVKRYVHQPLAVDHYGLHAKIQQNGKVLITGIPDQSTGEYDEVEVPASFIFKLAQLLKATRTVQFVPVGEIEQQG